MSSSTQLPVSIAIIGGGQIGPRHAQSIIKSPNAILTALVDPVPHGPAIAASLNTKHFNTISELLLSPQKPTAAIVCTPNHTHVSIAKELCIAGIHVLVEKPLSTNIDDGKDLIEYARKTNTHLLAGHHRRFNPYVSATKRALDKDCLGRIIAVQGTWALYKPPSYFEGHQSWHCGREAGAVLINLVHDIDILQYLLGPIVRVSAEKATTTRRNEADEGGAVLLKFKSGVVGTFIVTDNSPSPFNFECGTGENPMIPKIDAARGAGGFYRIFGTEGSLSVPDMLRWSHDRVEKSWASELREETLLVEQSVPFDSQVEHFVRVVRGEESPVCSGQAGLSALIVCDAVKRAMETGLPVDVEQVVV